MNKIQICKDIEECSDCKAYLFLHDEKKHCTIHYCRQKDRILEYGKSMDRRKSVIKIPNWCPRLEESEKIRKVPKENLYRTIQHFCCDKKAQDVCDKFEATLEEKLSCIKTPNKKPTDRQLVDENPELFKRICKRLHYRYQETSPIEDDDLRTLEYLLST